MAIFARQPQPEIDMLPEISVQKVRKISKKTEITLIFSSKEERETMRKLAKEFGIESVVSFVDYKMKPSDKQYVLKEEIISSPQKSLASALSVLFFGLGLIMF